MKTNAIIRIVLFSILLVVLIGVLVLSVLGYMGFRAYSSLGETGVSYEPVPAEHGTPVPAENGAPVPKESNAPVSGAETAPAASVRAEEIRELEIKWVFGHVTIEAGDVEEIQFRETHSDRPMYWYVEEDTLTIQFWKGKWPIIGSFPSQYRKDLKITVPRSWVGGEISIEAVEADVDLRDLAAEELEFDGVSGSFDAENCRIGEVDMDTVSGNIRYTGTLTELDVDSVSADCTLELTNVPREINMDGVSGDLDVTLPGDAGLDVKLSSASGRLTTDFTGTQNGKTFRSGDGACRISVEGVSGNVTVRKAP